MKKKMNVGLANFSYKISENPNQNEFKMHVNSEYEFYYFISGKGVFHIEGNDYPLKKGDILIMNNMETHYIEIDPKCVYERLVVHFKKEYLKKIDDEGRLLEAFENRQPGKNNLFRKDNFKDNHYLTLINNIILGICKSKIAVETSFFALLNEIYEAFPQNYYDNYIPEDTLISQVVNYILENISEELTVEKICNEFSVSETQLSRKFKKTMGNTLWNYVKIKRVTMAKRLIEEGEKPTKAYLKCGFLDYSNFYRAYKKYYGISPKEIN